MDYYTVFDNGQDIIPNKASNYIYLSENKNNYCYGLERYKEGGTIKYYRITQESKL